MFFSVLFSPSRKRLARITSALGSRFAEASSIWARTLSGRFSTPSKSLSARLPSASNSSLPPNSCLRAAFISGETR